MISFLTFFTLITINHALFLFFGKSQKKENKIFWNIHLILNGILWLVLLSWIILIQFNPRDFQPLLWIQILGAVVFLGGTLLVINAFNRLGLKYAMGYRFFTKEKQVWISRGIYSKLDNPMYDGFVLILIGLGLFLG